VVGIREIARDSGVSIATVSRALHGRRNVDPVLREKVEQTAAALGYRPNMVARNLRTQRTGTIGVIVPNIGNAYFADIVRAIQDVATASKYTALVINSDSSAIHEDAAIRTLDERQVDGLILVSSTGVASHALASLIGRGAAVLAADRAIRGVDVDHVLVDTRTGTREAVAHLAALGRRRIAFIAGPKGLWTAGEKLAGFKEGLRKAGLKFDKSLVLAGAYTFESGEAQAHALLALKPRADAVIIANNLMTLGAMRVFLRQSIAMPKDLALVGFDDAAWTDVVRPAVSVVSQPARELGALAMKTILARLEAPGSAPVRQMLETQFLPRESTLGVQ
jgi:LacI family transcriptional regulator